MEWRRVRPKGESRKYETTTKPEGRIEGSAERRRIEPKRGVLTRIKPKEGAS